MTDGSAVDPAIPADPSRPAVGRLDTTPPSQGERFDALVAHASGTRVEHIVSTPTADDARYDQDHDEWVVLLHGAATLDIDGTAYDLTPGTWAWLPAHTPHRVMRCAPGTRWLAVHLPPR